MLAALVHGLGSLIVQGQVGASTAAPRAQQLATATGVLGIGLGQFGIAVRVDALT